LKRGSVITNRGLKKYMPEESTADDLEKAHMILSEFGLLIGPAGAMSDVIARAVAAGIALGRREALAKTRRSVESKTHR
jgi:hypothetical protein